MTAKDLKNALLQEAVQGKLVPQIASEGNARDLLEEIRKERGESDVLFSDKSKSKTKLVSEASLPLATARKRSSATPSAGTPRNAPMEISEDEIPFDIPESWCWCRLGEVIDLLSGQDFEPQFYNNKGNGIPYITGASNIEGERVIINRWTETPKNIALKNDLLLVCKGSGYGTTVIADFEKAHIARQIMSIRSNINLGYIRLFLSTQFKYIKSQGKGLIPGIDRKTVLGMLFPLPPLAEQKRIVAAIEKFMPLIEEYGKKETVLNELNTQIGTLTKKAILQEAVQGKLVPQIPTEGNAKDLLEQIKAQKAALIKEGKIKKEKPLPEITEDEIPFDIPENWCWCRVGDLFSTMSGLGYKKDVLEEKTNHMIRVLRGGNILDTSYVFKDDDIMISSEYVKPELFLKKNYLITPAVTSLEHIGKMGYVEKDYDDTVVGGFVLMLIPYLSDETISKYCLYLFGTHWFRTMCKEITHKSGQAFYNLSRDKLLQLEIPLPPLSEQKRIVEAIEQLLPLCEKLGN